MKKLQNIIIADDHPIYRVGLETAVKPITGIGEIIQASNGSEVVELLKMYSIDIIIMNIQLPELDGIATARIVKKKYFNVKVILISFLNDRLSILNSIKSGIIGYLTKNTSVEDIRAAVKNAIEGKRFYSPEIDAYLLNNIDDSKFQKENLELTHPLTKRETEIVRFVALGYTSNEIGNELFIARKTVEAHRSRIFEKLKIKNSIDLIHFAYKNELITKH